MMGDDYYENDDGHNNNKDGVSHDHIDDEVGPWWMTMSWSTWIISVMITVQRVIVVVILFSRFSQYA